MRLLDVRTCKLHTFYGTKTPPYAILSHTWLADAEEITFDDIVKTPASLLMSWPKLAGFESTQKPPWMHKSSIHKLRFLCTQAMHDGLEYAWIDTCCIDKANSTELSEAINSMFQWYSRANVCYVYLHDYEHDSTRGFAQSRWFRRGWTLQELLAPRKLAFFDRRGILLGKKDELAATLSTTTGIDQAVLEHPSKISRKSVAERMSWAANRQTTRLEDRSYCLLGIFDVNMPMLYGEGDNAFQRLQREIMNSIYDQSLFAWGFIPQTSEELIPRNGGYGSVSYGQGGIFAQAPDDFSGCRGINPVYEPGHPVIEERHGIFFTEYQLVKCKQPRYYLGILPCNFDKQPQHLIGILLCEWTSGRMVRCVMEGVSAFLVSTQTLAAAQHTRRVSIDTPRSVDSVSNHAGSFKNGLAKERVSVVLDLSSAWTLIDIESNDWHLNPNRTTIYFEKPAHMCKECVFTLRHKTADTDTKFTLVSGEPGIGLQLHSPKNVCSSNPSQGSKHKDIIPRVEPSRVMNQTITKFTLK